MKKKWLRESTPLMLKLPSFENFLNSRMIFRSSHIHVCAFPPTFVDMEQDMTIFSFQKKQLFQINE